MFIHCCFIWWHELCRSTCLANLFRYAACFADAVSRGWARHGKNVRNTRQGDSLFLSPLPLPLGAPSWTPLLYFRQYCLPRQRSEKMERPPSVSPRTQVCYLKAACSEWHPEVMSSSWLEQPKIQWLRLIGGDNKKPEKNRRGMAAPIKILTNGLAPR